MKKLILSGLILMSPAALSQEKSDLMPPEPAPPAGARPWYPGAPMPTPPRDTQAPGGVNAGRAGGGGTVTNARTGTGAANKQGGPQGNPGGGTVTESPSGGRYVEEAAPPSEMEPETLPGQEAQLPETHVVKKGDTLWDISASYFKNAFAWPKLWSFNPSITNPHWIYPGDVIRLAPGGESAAPIAVKPEETAPAPGPAPENRAPRPAAFTLRDMGFVEAGEIDSAGRIVGSKEEKIMLAERDEAYVEFKKGRAAPPGQRVSIYHPMREVRHPTTGRSLGWIVQIFGEGEMRPVRDGKFARMFITDSNQPIERGFLVGPLRRQFANVEPRPGHADLSGAIVALLYPSQMIATGTDQLVFLDRGRKDGVEIGNRFLVVRRGDGYQPILSTSPVDDKRYPRENIGEIIVVDLRDSLATGVTIRSAKEMRVGDRVETRKGY